MMIIRCDSCNTSFRLDPARLKGPSSKVRCTRCGNVFTVQAEEEDFIQVDISDEPVSEDEPWEQASPVSPKPTSPRAGSGRSIPWRRLAVVGGVVVVLAVVFIYASWKTSANLEGTDHTKIAPKNMEQPTVAMMEATNAYFLENTNGGGQFFVVEGETANESTRPVSFILVEGKLFSKSDQVVQVQRCYCGNAMTRDELARWSLTDIQNQMMNREGRKMLNVNIPPGKHIPFTIVFHNLPDVDSLGNFGLEVISSKFE